MRSRDGTREGGLILSATDLANHLGCRYRTTLDMAVAWKEREPPHRKDDALEVLIERGRMHEDAYVAHLEQEGRRVVRVSADGIEAMTPTIRAMREGADVIVQGLLEHDGWHGRLDILMRVEKPSAFGSWSYEVEDTKLARETRAGTILQLCLYSDLLASVQAQAPESFRVVAPGDPFQIEAYRLEDYAAYYRHVRRALLGMTRNGNGNGHGLVAEPVPHCDVCRWWVECNRDWRARDALWLVASLTRLHARELQSRGIATLEALAHVDIPLRWKPRRGSPQSLVRVREQARVQLAGRTAGRLHHERILPIEVGKGLALLPPPSPGDLFLDLEGDPFVGRHGLEFLFGLSWRDPDGAIRDEQKWALDAAAERKAFDWLVRRILEARERDPGMHVYHYAPYEPAAVKRLMGRYGMHEDPIDQLFREQRWVDLYAAVRNGVRASVERYSIKDLEPFFGHEREIELREVSRHMHALARALELGLEEAIEPQDQAVVAAYNRDDCRSALGLRDWLERQRMECEADGHPVPRPTLGDAEPSEKITEKIAKLRAMSERLRAGLGPDPEHWSAEERARERLSNLVEFHRREEKSVWWEYYRLKELPEDELLDEPAALARLVFDEREKVSARGKPTDRYRFESQECELYVGAELILQSDGKTFGEIEAIDPVAGRVSISKAARLADEHPTALFSHDYVSAAPMENALLRLSDHFLEQGFDHCATHPATRDLLLAERPGLRAGESLEAMPHERPVDHAVRVALALDQGVLPVQGPPGSGKTYTGARMILALLQAGRRVGVTANGHKVIKHLMDGVMAAAAQACVQVAAIRKVSDKHDPVEGEPILEVSSNEDVIEALTSGAAQLAGGTAWMWSRPEYANCVDVLFVDEAGQMSLANALAVSQAAPALVLLGDPCQLEQPIQGTHPDGVAISALEHLLGEDHATLPPDRGLFLPQTWRLPPPICAFTSETFYERRLSYEPATARQELLGGPWAGAGLWFVPVAHSGNTNHSCEEVDAVDRLVEALLTSGVRWIDRDGSSHALRGENILVVAPYNAQVSRLVERLEPRGVRAGTVDRFQGQEAPVAIYSLATSSPDEAPRGMEFLYSHNRLNVATSRAQCVSIVVANPALFEPECRSPRQMKLANAFCRYLERANILDLDRDLASRPILTPGVQENLPLF